MAISGIGVGGVAAREQTLLAEPAGAATDRERDDDTGASLQVRDFRTDLHHLAHILVAEFHFIDFDLIDDGAQLRTPKRDRAILTFQRIGVANAAFFLFFVT